MEAVKALPGCTLTLDWLAPIEAGKPANGFSAAEGATYARGDLDAITKSDVMWLLAPESVTRGAWFEVGFAMGLRQRGPKIIASGNVMQSIFLSLVHPFAADADALAYLKEVAEIANG